MAYEWQTSAQVPKSPKGPTINVEKIGEAHSYTLPTTIKNKINLLSLCLLRLATSLETNQ